MCCLHNKSVPISSQYFVPSHAVLLTHPIADAFPRSVKGTLRKVETLKQALQRSYNATKTKTKKNHVVQGTKSKSNQSQSQNHVPSAESRHREVANPTNTTNAVK